ncbi:uncharacterized protein BXZ73DRAFT_78864 [Epithele typhae]|uniref:uncharacterized protein n=1 Tax=Epithele typhae TaxID=378194 RepID=UPI002008A627|nr:uncharacterized protein BXZ73DRAFT_78864 [Epithele typhae]KAH9925884.1 hypothetical protein BXZ73DRAFT_78864 [Epithele typhae]
MPSSSSGSALVVPHSGLVVPTTPLSVMTAPYKGKHARSWQNLPPEIVRLIATFYLLDVSSTSYCPTTWESRDAWPQRFAFTTLGEALEVERVMSLFPAWRPHLESHLFWNKACALLDPCGVYNHHLRVSAFHPAVGSNTAAPIPRITMYRHYRNMLDTSCTVCRINFPHNNQGLCVSGIKKGPMNPSLGPINVCKDHRKGGAYCGVCLREAPQNEVEEEYAHTAPVYCLDNEDDETWPRIETTCRACRSEALWRRVNMRDQWREAIDISKYASLDWETRQAVESFLDLSEGSIRDVLVIAEDKLWLRRHTKLADMLQQAVAAQRYASRADSNDPYGEDDASDEEDVEMLSFTEETHNIRELALNNWARNRVLDGHWISPADEWFGSYNNGRPRFAAALHPCPWNRGAVYEGALDEGQDDEAQELEHPRPKTVIPHPPSFTLCEHAFRAFQKQMGEVLRPAMMNIVAKLMVDCAADGVDPATRAAKMTPSDIVHELRDESVWYNGIDWRERRANMRIEEAHRRRVKDEDESSTSSRSEGSHTTSPVLSTTTLQTTPSPPPSAKGDEHTVSSPLAGAPPPSVVTAIPRLLHPIPYVPTRTDHLPTNSQETIGMIWREVCAPLYHCQCSICERAMLNANMAGGVPVQTQPTTEVQQPQQTTQAPLEIKIQESPILAISPDADVEDFNDSEIEDFYDGESERSEDVSVSIPESPVPVPTLQVISRKRSCSDLELDAQSHVLTTCADPDDRSRTPPKRARREDSYEYSLSPAATVPPLSSSPSRQRKRSSEELEGGDEIFPTSGKRLRPEVTDVLSMSPMSTPAAVERLAVAGTVSSN